jgi:hypothetical protein
MKRLVQFGAATLSAYLYAQLNPMFIEFLLKLSRMLISWPRLCYYDCQGNFHETDYTPLPFFWFASWLAAYAICEFVTRYKKNAMRSRLLLHLRYGPLTMFLIFALLVPVARWEAIERSKWRISEFVEDGPSANLEFYNSLYVEGLRTCENEMASPEYKIYATAAAEGLQSDNPIARIRALQVSSRLYDWQALPCDSPFIEALKQANLDDDLIFRERAKEYVEQIREACMRNPCTAHYLTLNALGDEEGIKTLINRFTGDDK